MVLILILILNLDIHNTRDFSSALYNHVILYFITLILYKNTETYILLGDKASREDEKNKRGKGKHTNTQTNKKLEKLS